MEGTSNRMDSQTNHDRPLRHKALARKKTHAAFMQLARTKPSSGLGRAKASQHRQRAPRIPLAETPQVESKKKNEPNPKTTEANGCCIHGNPSSSPCLSCPVLKSCGRGAGKMAFKAMLVASAPVCFTHSTIIKFQSTVTATQTPTPHSRVDPVFNGSWK